MNIRGFLVTALAVSLVVPALGLAQPATSSDYRIGVDDILSIQVWDNKDLDQIVFVRPDGKISLPLLGEVHAGGKTVVELQGALTELYSKTVKGPQVSVGIREIRSRPVFFLGGFGKTGPMQHTQDVNMLQAISMAGGLLPAADLENGFVLRGDKKIPIDFYRLTQKGDLAHNIRIQPGDTVFVPLADVVYVQGEVKTPGLVKYTKDLTLVKAIISAGGLTPLAAGRRVTILRGEGNKKENMRVNFNEMVADPETGKDMPLKPNDIIMVPQRLF